MQALNQIGTYLQKGDITDAQTALASLQQQQQAAGGAGSGHHHHHGGGGGGGGGDQVAGIGIFNADGGSAFDFVIDILVIGKRKRPEAAGDASTTVVSEVATPNPDGSVTITATNADGSQTISTVPGDQLASGSTSTNGNQHAKLKFRVYSSSASNLSAVLKLSLNRQTNSFYPIR